MQQNTLLTNPISISVYMGWAVGADDTMRIVQGRVLSFCTLVICYYSIIASVDSVLSSPPGINSYVG